ncbi:MAG: relaxase domain-containing protein [Elainella sp. C42_A2020_010]|nr:relaxase domain-containing protein [Elainella sp. C42_A2020_010]
MLSTSNVSAAQAENYYTQEDYYTQEESDASHWFGKGATALGTSGSVDQFTFQRLLHGKTPNGQSLSGKRIDSSQRRAATDYTFSAPKSVSIAALVQQDARVLQAHHHAVTQALAVLESRYAQTRVSTATGRHRVVTGNLVAAVFPHTTSRAMEPQLHSHCVVINATQLSDGQWRSFSNEEAIANQKLLGQIYQNELAVALRQQGYQIELRPHGQFELAGYSPELRNLFSTRRQQVKTLLALWEAEDTSMLDAPGQERQSSRSRREAAALRSRQQKPKAVTPDQLLRGWNALVQLKGLELPPLPTFGEANAQVIPQTSENAKSAVQTAIDHCSERETVFQQTKLERFVFEHQLGQQSFEDLQEAIATSPELIGVKDRKFTTQSALDLELNTIRLMQSGQGQVKPITDLEEVNGYLEKKTLTVGQQQAIQLAATTRDQFIAWQGVAGSGKSDALREVKAIAQAHGYQVRGFAPSAEAAHSLGQILQVEAETVAKLLVFQERSHSNEATTHPELWLVDEASLLSMKSAHDLLSLAKDRNARVVLIGDTKQLSAVEAGNPFKSLQARGMATARLDESLRQRTQELKTAVAMIAQGKVVEGIQALDTAGYIQQLPSSTELLNQIVQDYLRLSLHERDTTLLLAGTNRERLNLTQKLRQALQADATLGDDTVTVVGLRQRDLTSAQAGYVTAYASGDVLVPTQDYRKQGLYKHQQYTVLVRDRTANQLTLETPTGQLLMINPAQCQKKTVYEVQPIPVAAGDRLRWTKNNRDAGTRNGQTFTVNHITPDGLAQITNSDDQAIEINLSGRQYLDYAWVSTTYSSQGKTADRVLALVDSITTNRESFYVTVSRAKHHLSLYTTDKVALAKLAQRTKAKKNVSDYIPLFQVVPNHAQTSQTSIQLVPASCEHRDLAKRIGERIGERIGNHVRQQLTTDRPGTDYPPTASGSTGTANSADTPDGTAFASTLEPHVEPLSAAIAGCLEERNLIECAGDLAEAATAVDFSLEYLERSTENRDKLAAAVDRLHTAIRTQTRQLQQLRQFDSKLPQQRSQQVAEVPGKAAIGQQPSQLQLSEVNVPDGQSPTPINQNLLSVPHSSPATSQNDVQTNSREHYQQMWQRYSQGVQANVAIKLDYLVSRKAFEDGHSQKEIALMLAAGSSYVAQIHHDQGKDKAKAYVSQTAKAASQQGQYRQSVRSKQEKELEL